MPDELNGVAPVEPADPVHDRSRRVLCRPRYHVLGAAGAVHFFNLASQALQKLF